jgi:predicted glycoside hydrolase/deacetylase ChbG (UPF0249 family)
MKKRRVETLSRPCRFELPPKRPYRLGSEMSPTRYLIVTADDFGIGPPTSKGILGLAQLGRLTTSVLLVNSPYAEESIAAWRCEGEPIDLGWHACLTLDRPVSPPRKVPSLVDADGRFRPLAPFLKRVALGLVRRDDVRREFQAQCERFIELTGRPPAIVNSHHHIHAIRMIGRELAGVSARFENRPFVRRVREPWRKIASIPGARGKRILLNLIGSGEARRLDRRGYPGADWLAGVSDCRTSYDPELIVDWLSNIPGRNVEWACHPGEFDPTLAGRDGDLDDGSLEWRVNELAMLADDRFVAACRRAGFVVASPSILADMLGTRGRYVA